MKLVEEMEKLQKQYYGTIILVKNGIFFCCNWKRCNCTA